MTLEIQTNGVTSSLEEFELRLRACGASEGQFFRTVETVFKVPPSPDGAVKGTTRLIKTFTGPDSFAFHLLQDREIKKNPTGIVKASQVDFCSLVGDAESSLKHLGFLPEFHIGRIGKRVFLASSSSDNNGGGWEVEYFQLYQVDANTRLHQVKSVDIKIPFLSTSTSDPCWMVTIKRRFEKAEEEKDLQLLFAQALSISKRLSPTLQPVSWLAIESE